MTYTAGGLIQASDYNGFVNDSANNINKIWGVGSGDFGYGQTSIPTVTGNVSTVTATQWASLVNTLSNIGSQTGSTLTSRTAPVAGNTISVLANVATDINTLTNNRGNNSSINSWLNFTGSFSKTTPTGSGSSAWTITFTTTLTFASANAARYFFNAGGLVKISYRKESTGTDHDPDWNAFVLTAGLIYFSGRVNNTTNYINGNPYTGTTRVFGSGSPTVLATTTGFHQLVNGASPTTIFQINNSVSPYQNEYIRTTVALGTSSTVLTFVTTWVDDGATPVIDASISGGTASTYTFDGTAPATLVELFQPSTTWLTNTWGPPIPNGTVS